MNTDDYPAFAEFWGALLGQYGRRPDDTTVAMAFAALRAYPLEEVQRAGMAHLQDTGAGVYAPKPADLLRVLSRGPDDAWQSLIESIERIGPYRGVDFGNSGTAAGVRAIGGWTHLCTLTYSELEALRPRFAQAYEQASPETVTAFEGLDSAGHYLEDRGPVRVDGGAIDWAALLEVDNEKE